MTISKAININPIKIRQKRLTTSLFIYWKYLDLFKISKTVYIRFPLLTKAIIWFPDGTSLIFSGIIFHNLGQRCLDVCLKECLLEASD